MAKTGGKTKVSEEEIREQITALGSPLIGQRHEAIAALRETGAPAIAPLIEALLDAGDNDRRWYAAVALAKIGESSIGPLIAAMQEHGERDFRRYAAAALGEIGIPAIEQMITAMGGNDREMRGFLSQALCRIGTPAIEPLRQRLVPACAGAQLHPVISGRHIAVCQGLYLPAPAVVQHKQDPAFFRNAKLNRTE